VIRDDRHRSWHVSISTILGLRSKPVSPPSDSRRRCTAGTASGFTRATIRSFVCKQEIKEI
jgi:hypothetical protein